MKTIAIIPARMAATRFPNKPLASISGLPMIEHVRRRTLLCSTIDDVWVATCDEEIKSAVESFGGKAIMTGNSHERCTDRIAEANRTLGGDLVVNVQGDEPLIAPDAIDGVVTALREGGTSLPCVNAISPIGTEEELRSSNVVKATLDINGHVLFFSRYPIPYSKDPGIDLIRYKQLGLMAFRGEFLATFARLTPTPLEAAESVDMLRALEHGYPIKTYLTNTVSIGVDVPSDIERVEQLMITDSYRNRY